MIRAARRCCGLALALGGGDTGFRIFLLGSDGKGNYMRVSCVSGVEYEAVGE